MFKRIVLTKEKEATIGYENAIFKRLKKTDEKWKCIK